MKARAVMVASLLLAIGCPQKAPRTTYAAPEKQPEKESTVNTRDVENILATATSDELGYFGSKASRALAALGDAPAALRALAGDPARPPAERFKAFEAMGGLKVPVPEAQRADAAGLYVDALRNASEHDEYGLPDGTPDGPGARLVALGPAAVAALVTLLDDERPLLYEGSEEPTIAELRRYRVKDLAGRYLAAILQRPFDVEEVDPAARDRQLDELRSAAK